MSLEWRMEVPKVSPTGYFSCAPLGRTPFGIGVPHAKLSPCGSDAWGHSLLLWALGDEG